MPQITPCLWFADQAEEAANFYTSIFKDSEIVDVQRYGEGGPAPAGSVLMVTFSLNGQRFLALNGGTQAGFTEAISLHTSCRTQQEVDDLWARLSDGGQEGPCGWLTDRYGVSWQVIPDALPELLSDPDEAKAARVMQAMMGMKKIDIQALRHAHTAAA